MIEGPACSVIVPTHNRPEQLRRCLEGLSELDYPKDRLQVIIVDDDGGGGEAVVEPMPRAFALVTTSRVGPAAARNAGVEHATGELLAFIDDDCRPHPDWLSRLAARYCEAPDEAVGGRTVNALRESLCSEAAQLVIDVGYAQNNLGPPDRRWFTTNNLAVPKAGFYAIGGFDAGYRTAEDRDFCSRWTESGRAMSYDPKAVVEHFRRLDLAEFAAMHFAYGRGAFRYHRDRRDRGRPVAVEPGYYVALAREALRRGSGSRAAALEGLLVVWHLSNTAGFLSEWVRSHVGRDT
jgi:glycosyltransferase involved in cell wall biosynthesis